MKCTEAKKYLQGIIDGNVMDDKDVISHIGSCADCTKEYKAIKALKNALSFNEKTEIPADFNERVWKKINRPSPSIPGRIFGARPTVSFVFKTAAAFAAIIFMVVMFRNSFVKNETVASVSPQAQVKTVVAKTVKHIRKPAGAEPNVNKATAPAAEVAVNSVPVNKSGEFRSIDTDTGKISSPGKGPATAPKIFSMKFNKANAAPQAAKNAPVSSGVTEAGISKNTGETLKKEEELSGPVEIRNNVFNPAQGGKITLKYQVKTASPVIVQVYNKKGESIKSIFKGTRQPGIYEVSWDGTNDSGSMIAADMYIVYIKTDMAERRIKAAVVK